MAAGGLSTMELADRLGVTFRQLDYLASETGCVELVAGGRGQAGRQRVWPEVVVAKLSVATALANASGGRPWSSVAKLVLEGPVPPPSGWALLDPLGNVRYGGSPADLGLWTHSTGGTLVRYQLSTPPRV